MMSAKTTCSTTLCFATLHEVDCGLKFNPFWSARRASVRSASQYGNLFREFRMEPLMRDVETMPRIRVDISEDDQAYSVPGI
jgi:hypothetical protein